jgi:AmiR/NasT family two-component response regulator
LTLAPHYTLTRTVLVAGFHLDDLRESLAEHDHVTVMGDTTDAATAVIFAGRMQPDYIIFDECIDRFDAVGAAIAARRVAPGSTIVLLTGDPNVERCALRAGVDFVYGKSATVADILGYDY